MKKEKANYTIKKTLCSFGLASVLLMTGCNKLEDNNQSIGNEATIVSDDSIEKQEVTIRIAENNREDILDSLKKLENDLPNIIIDNKVTGLEIVMGTMDLLSSYSLENIELIEIIENIAESCPDLTSLSISGLYINDKNLTWISSLTNLTHLDLSENCGLTDISFIETLSHLESLNICSCYNVEDISCLATINNLEALNISWCSSIDDISVISDLPNLSYFKNSGCRSLHDEYTSYNRGIYNSREEIEKLIELIKEDSKGYQLIFEQAN